MKKYLAALAWQTTWGGLLGLSLAASLECSLSFSLVNYLFFLPDIHGSFYNYMHYLCNYANLFFSDMYYFLVISTR